MALSTPIYYLAWYLATAGMAIARVSEETRGSQTWRAPTNARPRTPCPSFRALAILQAATTFGGEPASLTKRIHLLGHPVSHSVSPAFQQAALDSCSIDWRVHGPGHTAFRAAYSRALPARPRRAGRKRHRAAQGGRVSTAGQRIGGGAAHRAVNTIHNRDGALEGHNTDARGFLSALREEAGFEPRGRAVLILGAGGSARAVAVALAGEGVSSIVIANRTVERAAVLANLVRTLGVTAQAIASAPSKIREAGQFEPCVNCTSWAWQAAQGPPKRHLGGPDTAGCARVRPGVQSEGNAPAEGGGVGRSEVAWRLPMLVYQGAASFEIWTGVAAPAQVMFAAAEAALAARQAARS